VEKHLIEATADGVATLTLNRPEQLNALSTPIMEGLLEALPRLAADPATGAIVLTGGRTRFLAFPRYTRLTLALSFAAVPESQNEAFTTYGPRQRNVALLAPQTQTSLARTSAKQNKALVLEAFDTLSLN
jgi:hypothetical protein